MLTLMRLGDGTLSCLTVFVSNLFIDEFSDQQQLGMGPQIRGQMMDFDSVTAPPNMFIPQYPGPFVRATSNRMPMPMQQQPTGGPSQQQQTQVPLESIQLDGLFSVAVIVKLTVFGQRHGDYGRGPVGGGELSIVMGRVRQ